MITYIALLRGINVGGQNKIRMQDLQRLLEEEGLGRVRTYLQSGNVVFDAASSDRAPLASQIEQAILVAYGFDIPVILREAPDLRRIIATNPFLTQRREDPAKLHVLFLAERPAPAAVARMVRPDGESGEWIVGEQEIFLFMPDGVGRSKLTNAFFESRLKTATTGRNWNTVNALLELAEN